MKIVSIVVTWYVTMMARMALWRSQPTVIAITGSVGKTTTKDILVAQLRSTGSQVGGTIRSQNSDISTPLSIFNLELQNKERRIGVWLGIIGRTTWRSLFMRIPRYLVLEVGAGGPGDITTVARWVRPHVAVYTALAENPVHVEYFQDREHLFQEKKELARHTDVDGVVVFPAQDQFLPTLLQDVAPKKVPVDVSGLHEVEFDVQGTHARYHDHNITIAGVWSETLLRSYVLGLTVLQELGLEDNFQSDQFSQHYQPTPGRTRLLQGINDSTVLDDSYNASPVAVTAFINLVRNLPGFERKIFVFGDMKELGDYAQSAHQQVGREAAEVFNLVLTVGNESKITNAMLLRLGMHIDQVKHFESSKEAGEWLRDQIQSGDLVVAKSSRHAIRMEQCLEQIVTEENKQYLIQEYLDKQGCLA